MIDVFSVAVLALVVFAFFRRIVLQPRLIPMSRDAAAILGAIGLLMITYFGMQAARRHAVLAEMLAGGRTSSSCWRSSTTCSTRSTATSWRRCPTSTSASSASAASCPS